jgi:hypothetical protein
MEFESEKGFVTAYCLWLFESVAGGLFGCGDHAYPERHCAGPGDYNTYRTGYGGSNGDLYPRICHCYSASGH